MSAVIFDLDGTLWDSVVPIWHAWAAECERLNVPHVPVTRELLASLMGKTAAEIQQLIFPALEPEAQQSAMPQLFEAEQRQLETESGAIYPGVRETLEQLSARYALFIVSNSQDGYVQTFLRWLGGNWFLDYEMSGRTGLTKGKNIRLVMERNRIERAVYVGDTQMDADAAVEARIPFIHAAYGFGAVPEARWKIVDFSELPALISRIL